MIAFFPDPYPDELLYSICSRYFSILNYSNSRIAIQELFGENASVAVVDLPSHLDHLIQAIPSNVYTADSLIDNHTLLPFYSPFLSPDCVKWLREQMQGSSGTKIQLRSGISTTRIRPCEWFRFCPICAEEDKQKFGEYYWHRLHQVPGVKVCPVHNVFLEQSTAQARNRKNSFQLISADSTIKPTLPRFINSSNFSDQTLVKIAHNAVYLLSQECLIFHPESLNKRYKNLLIKNGYSSYKGRVNYLKLKEDLITYYTSAVLTEMQCSLETNTNYSWLRQLIVNLRNSKHPIYHLLLIEFLGLSLEQFFLLPEEPKYFGDSPWPCLNPVSEHYRQPKIKEYHVRYQPCTQKPIGTFCCNDCGFTYFRTGPDRKSEDRFRFSKLLSFGHEWETVLKNLWENSTVTIENMAHRLGVGKQIVRREAARLKLVSPRPSPRPKRPSRISSPYLPIHPPVTPDLIEFYRKEWLSAIQQAPEDRRRELKENFTHIYIWLQTHDHEWFRLHLPSLDRKQGKSYKTPLDWNSRDAKLAEVVKATAKTIASAQGTPVRITKTVIFRHIGVSKNLLDKLSKLPITVEILSKVVETEEAFAIRRIWWLADCYIQENVNATRKQLLHRFSGRYRQTNSKSFHILELPKVKNEINTALDFISSSLNSNL